ncbi:MAG: ABC transporter ATP-binding protein, partial [Myxococcota bacterium]
MPALAVRGLTRRFGARVAVDDLHLTVHPGDVYGFLGPNGAGKTTAMRCMIDLIRRDGGEVEIFGLTGRAARHQVGAMIEAPAFHPTLSGWANLALAADYRALPTEVVEPELDRVLTVVGLRERAKDRVGGYSQGMRQRLGIARAMLGRPPLLLLDEPTNGLDPQGMREVRDLLRSLAQQEDVTIFLSSHLLAEVQALCNRVGILTKGKLRAEGDVESLIAESQQAVTSIEIGTSDAEALLAAAEDIDGLDADGRTPQGR